MNKPLAFKARPQTIDDIAGQEHLVGDDGILRNLLENQQLYSMIFFGPSGTGKTTTAIALANALNRPYRLFNAVTDNKKKLDQLFAEAQLSQGLIVIIDEVHRLNKDKQDVLLPHIENGLITLIGATTANPFFSINPAIRSRVHLFEFYPLENDDIGTILKKASQQTSDKTISDAVFNAIIINSNGDARYALNTLELLIQSTRKAVIDLEDLKRLSLSINLSMDKDSDHHYDALSAFQKSIRGSDVQAALYYLAKLIEVGDMVSIERRLIVSAYEDIGLANPALCARVVQAVDAAKRIGFPEAAIPLGNAVIECALSPKSKGAYHGIQNALETVRTTAYPVPKHLRLTPVGMSPDELYDYNRKELWHRIQYLPDAIKDQAFYTPQNLNSAEKTYETNLNELNKTPRTGDIKTLNRTTKKATIL